METAKQVVQNILGRGDRHDETATSDTANSSAIGQSYADPTNNQHTGSSTTEERTQSHHSGSGEQFDSGPHSTGTALGGRASGNVAETALHTGTGSHGTGTSTGPAANVPVNYHQVTNEGGRVGSGLTGTGTETGTGTAARTDTDPTQSNTPPALTGDRTSAGQGISDTTAEYGDSRSGLTGTSFTQSNTPSTLTDDNNSAGYGRSGTTRPNEQRIGATSTERTGAVSSETYPQSASSDTRSSQAGVAAGDTYPQSGDLKSHNRSDSGYHDERSQIPEKKDPAVVEESRSKLTGTGEDGSHSAVFGLTPDGHKYDDTAHGHGSLRPTHSKDASNISTPEPGIKTSTGESVAEQMRDPRMGESADGRPATYTTSENKPGAGS